jgi:hypothetical protein
MKVPTLYLILGCTIALIPTVALAQSDPFGNGGDNRDPFNRAASGDTSGLMQLLNQAQLNGSRNNPNYINEQREQLNSATDDFRARQLQVLRQSAKKTPTAAPVETKK